MTNSIGLPPADQTVSPSSAPAAPNPAPQTQESAPPAQEAAPQVASKEEKALQGRLTPENIKLRNEIAVKKAGKVVKPAENLPKPPENEGEKPPKAAQSPKAPKPDVDGNIAEKPPIPAVKTKFVAMGKEYDLPKWAQEAAQDPGVGKELTELFEKATALDHVKMRHQNLFDQHSTLKKSHDEVVNGVRDLGLIFQDATKPGGNILRLNDFFDSLKIPHATVVKWAATRAQFEELPVDQKQMISGQLEAHRRAEMLEKQNQSLSQGASAMQVENLRGQLESSLQRPDISTAIQAFDSAPGRKPGDFRQRVIDHGEYTWLKKKVQLSPDAAVNEVIQMYGITPQQAQAMGMPTPLPQAQAAQVTAPAPTTAPVVAAAAGHRDVPTIPQVQSRGTTSPLKAKPKSIAELRQLSKDMSAGR